MIPVQEARCFVLSSCTTLACRQSSTEDALGLVLGEAILSTENVPPFANSAMDGYAVRAADTTVVPVRLRVVGSVMAGEEPATVVGTGEAVRIMTGAPMPAGADSVCMVEQTRIDTVGSVVIEQAIDPDTNVRHPGDDIKAGAKVFPPGTVLTPPHLGVLASLGMETVLVHPAPRVAVVSTGDELATAPGSLAPGKIRDTNRPALLAQLRVDGFEAVDLGTVGDDEAALAHVLEDGGSGCDALVASGGVSVGDRDIAALVLKELCGESMRWMQVAVKPAKPFAFGTLVPDRTPVFGLPGNPVSALVSYELFVRPALRAMAGFQVLDRPCLPATADADLGRRRDGKLHLVRVRAQAGTDGKLRVRPSGGQGSHMLFAMAEANALALVPDGRGVPAGGRVDIMLLDNEDGSIVGGRGPW